MCILVAGVLVFDVLLYTHLCNYRYGEDWIGKKGWRSLHFFLLIGFAAQR